MRRGQYFSIVIPNYNGIHFLKKLFKNLSRIKKHSLIQEIIVVDNGSTDGSAQLVKSLRLKLKSYKVKFKVILNKKNLGFAKAVNQGILAAKNDYLVVMNNDIRLESDWFLKMAEVINQWQGKEKISAYFGKVLDWAGEKIESTGLEFEIKGRAENRENKKISQDLKEKKLKEEKAVSFIWGAPASVVVYYKPALIEAGLFDEDFFAYEEDVDLSLRLQNLDWKTLYVSQAVAYHWGGGTSKYLDNLREKMAIQNWWFIIIKNYPLKIIFRYFPQILRERLKNIFALWRKTSFLKFPFVLMATYLKIFIKIPKILKKRRPLVILYRYEKS